MRIIGGLHRGRRLPFADLPGLRPSGDRLRETLFNWLAPLIQGSRCLDPFAGSGALGLEAASRGAGEVLLLDRAPQVIHQLQANIQLLGLQRVEALRADALEWLRGPAGRRFNLVFLDPPFADDLLAAACSALADNGWLAPQARIYLEADAARPFPPLPGGWVLRKEQRAGRVRFGLAEVAG